MIGKDATTAFFGGVYDHSNAAHNVRSVPTSFSPYGAYTNSTPLFFLAAARYETCWCLTRWYASRSGR
jgi:hypothetical protein